MQHFYLELPESPRARDAVRDAATGMGMEWRSDLSALPFEPSREIPSGRLAINARLADAGEWDRFTDALAERLLAEPPAAGAG